MDVLVEEKPTGTFSLGVGYSTYEKAMVTGGVSQENILGTGQKVYLNASLSSITHLYDLTYVQPYTFDTNISSAFNVFNTEWIFSTYQLQRGRRLYHGEPPDHGLRHRQPQVWLRR